MDAASLLRTLTAADSPLRQRLAELIVDHHLGQPLSALLAEAEAKALILQLLQPTALTALFETELAPALEQALATLGESNQPLGMLVEPQARARWVELFTRPGGPTFPYVAEAIDPTPLRALLSPVFQDVLLGFVSRLTTALGGAAAVMPEGGLLGRLGRDMGDRSKRWVDAGRNLMGGLGLEEKLRAVAAEFSQQAVQTFRQCLVARLQTDEGQALLRELLDHAIDQLLRTPFWMIRDDAQRIPLPELLALYPPAIAHASAEPLFEQLLTGELRRFYGIHGAATFATLLQRFDLHDSLRALGCTIVERNAHSLLASDAFAAWLDAWLAPSA